MDKREGILIVVIALVAAVLVVALVGRQVLGPQGVVLTASTTIATSVNTTSTTVSIPTTTTIRSYQGCLAQTPTVKIQNGDFSTGNFMGWNVTGTGFGTAPLNITYENSNAVSGYQTNNNYTQTNMWTGYRGVFFASTYQGGLSITPGNITSGAFEVTEPYLNFQIASPQNNNIYVEIMEDGVPVVRSYYNTFSQTGGNYRIFMNASMPLATLMCSNVTIKVVSDVVSSPATHYDFIAIGNFYLSRSPAVNRTTPVNQTLFNVG